MKLRHALLAAACAATVGISPVAAQSVFIEFSGTEIFLPDGAPYPARVGGTVNCKGQVEPTGEFHQPCGPGVAGSIRDRVVYAYEMLSAPPIQGLNRIVVNANFDASGEGPMWGTFTLAVLGGGTVEGTYTGTANQATTSMELKAVGHGEGGLVDGLQFRFSDVHVASPYGTLRGRILDPGGKH